jgi:RND family efflux transporter MFP subunit
MNRKLLISIIAGFLFILIGVALFIAMGSLRQPEERKEFTEANTRYVQIMTVSGTSEQVRLKGFGTVKPRVAVAIPAEIPGRITFRHPDLETGGLIPSDTVLLRIDPDTYRIQVQKAESNLADRQAQQNVLETEIKGFQRSVEVSTQNAVLAQRELERFERLAKDEATSKSQVDKMRVSLQVALSGKVKDENSYRQALARQASVQAGIQQAQAALAEARLNLGKTEIRAPFLCRVESRRIEVGEYVTPGKVLADLYDPTTLEVQVPTSLTDLAWLLPERTNGESQQMRDLTSSATVTFCLQGNGNGKVCWLGRISRLAGTIDEKTRTVDVVVEIPDAALPGGDTALPLLKGMFVEVELLGRNLNGIFKIPRSAISRSDTVNLFVNGKLAVRPVEIVKIEDESAFIAKGLQPGDQLITTILPETIPGMPLAIASGTALPAEAESAATAAPGIDQAY